MKWWIVAAVVVLTTTAVASPEDTIRRDLILDVPFVPQTEALCGGAAAAMVLRYWGARGVYADDFVTLVEDSLGGIRTGRLVADLNSRGYVALPFEGTEVRVREHLSAGRPIIALVEDRPLRYHYVVLVAWRKGVVLLHDPARAPFLVVSEERFNTAWAATGRWSLLVLPDTDSQSGTADIDTPIADTEPEESGTFASLVSEGVRFGRANDLDAAEIRLQAATAIWPDSAAAWRELAGIRFRQKQWPAAAVLARNASRLDPGDVRTWQLLGASYFLDDHPEKALSAWNKGGEPRLDLIQIEGLKRTRYAVVSDRLGFERGALVTASSFRLAERRLSDFPVFESYRLDYRPLPGGIVEVDAIVLERPLFLHGLVDAGILSVRTFVEKELVLSLASPVGSGALWSASWRWEANRPRIRVAVSGPGVAGLPGIFSVEGFREQQTYDIDRVATNTSVGRTIPQGTVLTSDGTVREVRRRAGVLWREWLIPNLLCETDLGFEQWEEQAGRFLSAGLALDLRPFRNALSLRIQATRWFAMNGGRSFAVGTADGVWRFSAPGIQHTVVEASVGYRASGAEAPPALWPGTGNGRGRADLLRAHPLLVDGIIRGPAFGRSLWSSGLEFDYRPWQFGPIRAGLVCFVDAAWSGGNPVVPTKIDAGVGFRFGELALDMAHGLTDGAAAFSLIWRVKRR